MPYKPEREYVGIKAIADTTVRYFECDNKSVLELLGGRIYYEIRGLPVSANIPLPLPDPDGMTGQKTRSPHEWVCDVLNSIWDDGTVWSPVSEGDENA